MMVFLTHGRGPFAGYEGRTFHVVSRQFENGELHNYFVDFFGNTLSLSPSDCMEVVNTSAVPPPIRVWERNRDAHDHAVYSDRLYEWDPEKYNAVCRKVWGDVSQMFYSRTPHDIERFLSLYLGYEVTLTGIDLEKHTANGNPMWVFCYRDGRTRTGGGRGC